MTHKHTTLERSHSDCASVGAGVLAALAKRWVVHGTVHCRMYMNRALIGANIRHRHELHVGEVHTPAKLESA